MTEKEFKWFNEDIITVVRGARTYQNCLPFGAYIDADDFDSPVELVRNFCMGKVKTKKGISPISRRNGSFPSS